MTQMTQIQIDGKPYTVEPGMYTLGELINHTGIPKTTGAVILKTPDKKFGLAQSFKIQGDEAFVTEAGVAPQSSNPNAPGYDPNAPPAVHTLPFGGPPAVVAVSTTNLASGKVGVAYSTPLRATGGKSPLTFSVTSGSLPVGLDLNGISGVISGTPTVAGTETFSVAAKDAAGVSSAPQPLSIIVAA
jgi:hypothetical protein